MNKRKLNFGVCFESNHSTELKENKLVEISYERAHELIYG